MHRDLVALLSGDQALAAIIFDRIQWGWPDFANWQRPCVSLTDVGSRVIYTLDGRVSGWRGTVQVDVWAEDQAAALGAADALRDVVDGFTGGGVSGDFKSILIERERLSLETLGDGQSPVGRLRMDLRISWVPREG